MTLCAICATKIHCTFRDKFRFCQTNQNLLPKSGPKGTHCSCERNGMIHSFVRTFPKQLPKVKLWSFDDFHVGFFESPHSDSDSDHMLQTQLGQRIRKLWQQQSPVHDVLCMEMLLLLHDLLSQVQFASPRPKAYIILASTKVVYN